MKDFIPKQIHDELLKWLEHATTNKQENSDLQATPNTTNQGKPPKESPDQIIYKLATENHNLYYDSNGTTYIEIQDIKQLTAINSYLIKIESSEFDRWINCEHYNRYNKAPNKQLLQAIKIIISEGARLNGQKIHLYNRIASINGTIYLDLGTMNRQMVKIDQNGWEVGTYPVYFKRHADMKGLPLPERGGCFNELLPFLPPIPERDQCLALCWLVASFFGGIERALLLIEGPQGTGKTTLAKMLKSFIDPDHKGAISYNDNLNEMAQMIDHHSIPYFDNVTSITRKVSDLICTAYSSGSYTKKKLYTDDSDFIFDLSGNAIFSSLRLLKPKSDFLDRCYKIEFEKTESSYRSKQQFSEKLEAVEARLFGAVLDVVSATMKKVGEIQPTGKYRTVDFDRYATAAAEVMGYGAKFFLEARAYSERIKIQSITNSTPLIEAISNFLKSHNNHYSGYMGKLLQQLPKFTSSPHEIPTHANVLARRINEIKSELNEAGIQFDRKHNDNNGALWELTLEEKEAQSAQESVHEFENGPWDDQEMQPQEEPLLNYSEIIQEVQPTSGSNPFLCLNASNDTIQNSVLSDLKEDEEVELLPIIKQFMK